MESVNVINAKEASKPAAPPRQPDSRPPSPLPNPSMLRLVRQIAGREFRSIMCSPTGLVLIGLYLGLSGYIFSLNVSVTQEATLRHTFATLAVLTVFIVPLITMRLLAEELRTGTFEVLIAHPVSDLTIVLGKFLAGWLSFVVISVPTLLYLLILASVGSPDWGPALSGYLGQQLLAAMLVALGLLISATTHSQVLAAMGAMVGGVLLWLAATASLSFHGWLGQALGYLAMLEHYAPFRRGIIDSRAVVYFLATMGMFLYLAVRAVESRRWKFGSRPGAVPVGWKYPRLAIALGVLALMALGESAFSSIARSAWTLYHTGLVALSVLLAAVPLWLNRDRLRYELGRRQAGLVVTVAVNSLLVVAIWSLATYLSALHYTRIDVTKSKRYALAEQTTTVLEQLQVPVEVTVVMTRPADLRQEITDLLAEYTARSRRITVRNIDPYRTPGELEDIRQRHNLPAVPSEEILVSAGDRLRRIPVAAMINQKLRVAGTRVVRGPATFAGEAEITSALIQLTRESPGRVVFLSGHAERDPDEIGNTGASTAAAELRRSGWIVDKHVVTPGAGTAFPADAAVVVVAGPRQKLSDEDLRALQGVLDRGGGVLALLEPGIDTGITPLLQPWDVRLDDTLVVDLQSHVATADPTSLYVTRFKEDHPIGKGMGGLAAVLPTARRVAVATGRINPNVFTSNFLHTSGNGWAVAYQPGQNLQIDRNRDRRGPISLGIACHRFQEFPEPGRDPLHGRLVVIGDSDFMSNQHVDMAGNLNLFLNSVDWLAGRQDLISVRPRAADFRLMTLTPAQSNWIFRLSVLLIPGAAVLFGVLVIVKRKRSV